MLYQYCEQSDECVPVEFHVEHTDCSESYLTWAGNDHAAHVGAYYDHIFDDIQF